MCNRAKGECVVHTVLHTEQKYSYMKEYTHKARAEHAQVYKKVLWASPVREVETGRVPLCLRCCRRLLLPKGGGVVRPC